MSKSSSKIKYIPIRLKELREKTGLTADAFAAIGGVKRGSQFHYESLDNTRYPDAQYFLNLFLAGVDIKYIITGERDENPITDDEKNLLELYRKSSSEIKKAAMAVLKSNQAPTESKEDSRTFGDIGQYVTGSIVNEGSGNFGVINKDKKTPDENN